MKNSPGQHLRGIILLLALVIFSPTRGAAQSVQTRVDVRILLDSLSSVLNRYYVSPQVAKSYMDRLNTNFKKGVYKQTKSPIDLAQRLLDDIQQTDKNSNLSIGYYPDVARILEIPNRDSILDLDQELRVEQAVARNYYFIKKDVLPGYVGYVRWDGFDEFVKEGLPVFDSAFRYVSHAKYLILDLRYNYGGSAKMSQALQNYFFENKKPLNHFLTRSNDTIKRYTDPSNTNFKLTMPVFILTSRNTTSAAEDLTYTLQQSARAKVYGDTTRGRAQQGATYSLGQGFITSIPIRRAYNEDSKTNWQGTGIIPDVYCESESALSKVLELIYKQEISKSKGAEQTKWLVKQLTEVKNGKYLGQPFETIKNSDAVFAKLIRDSIYGPTNVGIGYGKNKEYGRKGESINLSDPQFAGEDNSAWFVFNFERDTLLTFDLVPVDPADDYDFILFRCPGVDCIENIRTRKVKPDRECHSGFLSFNGATGLSKHAVEEAVGPGPGPTYSKAFRVKAGDIYYLMVNYAEIYTSSGKKPHGFTLYFHDYWPKKKPQILREVRFNNNEAILLQQSFAELNKVAEYLKKEKAVNIEVKGHTDNVGPEEKNRSLSQRRAQAVKDYLVSKGIDARRIQCKGYGSSSPIAPNSTEEGRKKNRRVEFSMIMK